MSKKGDEMNGKRGGKVPLACGKNDHLEKG